MTQLVTAFRLAVILVLFNTTVLRISEKEEEEGRTPLDILCPVYCIWNGYSSSNN